MNTYRIISSRAAARALLALAVAWANPSLGYQQPQAGESSSTETLPVDAGLAQPGQADSEPAASGSERQQPPPVYVPPRRGAPATRVGGGSRTAIDGPQIALLSPEHTGLTDQAAPTLYWYLSRDYSGLMEFVVTARDAVSPLLRLRSQAHQSAGFHSLDLAEHGVVLEPGRVYQWSVSIVRDENHRSRDVVALATIERLTEEPSLAGSSSASLAAAGLWYDALDAASRAIAQQSPDAIAARADRAALLEQVGLHSAAEWDRRAL